MYTMRAIRKQLGLISLMLVFTLLMAACGGNSKENTASPSSSPSVAASESSKVPEPSASEEKATITYSQWGTAEELQRVQELLNKFMETNPNITVKLEGKDWGSYWDGLTANAATGTLPDVFKTSFAYIEKYAELGVFKELDSLIAGNSFNLGDIDNSMLGLHQYKGKQVSLPIDANVIVFYYDKGLFDNAATNPKGAPYPGLEPTWDEIVDIGTKMTLDKNNKNPDESGFDASNIKQWGLSVVPGASMDWLLEPALWSNNAKLINEDQTLALNTPEAKEVLNFFIDITKNKHINTTPAQIEGLGGIANLAITTGKVAMNAAGSWNVAQYQEANTNYGITHLPKFKTTQTVVQPAGVAVSSSTKHEAAAFKLLSWLAGPEGQAELAKQGFSIPANKQAAEAYLQTAGADFKIFIDAQKYGIISPFSVKKTDLVWTFGEQVMKGPLSGDGDLDAAIADLQSKIQ
jgi:multiple sugar transport system substrate-binding protein